MRRVRDQPSPDLCSQALEERIDGELRSLINGLKSKADQKDLEELRKLLMAGLEDARSRIERSRSELLDDMSSVEERLEHRTSRALKEAKEAKAGLESQMGRSGAGLLRCISCSRPLPLPGPRNPLYWSRPGMDPHLLPASDSHTYRVNARHGSYVPTTSAGGRNPRLPDISG
eukprot:CAMPEP_0113705780 /NCGR_PEP_ID=MMETSP0038_2-20120614/27336_1 /TAXON_ID=2898 /ORGANISM="Cryptomonas paramecium" /LENGTH=172 /DNA_ID=CAMNT_0000630853 /DNA_START=165 /DNA_END=680 /DNA_ORIENTATION=- /assembly_acc=CAM_ASM_000170